MEALLLCWVSVIAVADMIVFHTGFMCEGTKSVLVYDLLKDEQGQGRSFLDI